MEFVKFWNMNERELLNKILDDCCNVISNSIIVRMKYEHNVDGTIFSNIKKDFVNDCRFWLKEFFENYQTNDFCRFLIEQFHDAKFEYINSRAELDVTKINNVIKKSLGLWLKK